MSGVVLSTHRVCLVDEPLNGRERGVVLDAEQVSASASGGAVKPDLLVGHADRCAAGGAIDLQRDSVEVAGHSASIAQITPSPVPLSGERAPVAPSSHEPRPVRASTPEWMA